MNGPTPLLAIDGVIRELNEKGRLRDERKEMRELEMACRVVVSVPDDCESDEVVAAFNQGLSSALGWFYYEVVSATAELVASRENGE